MEDECCFCRTPKNRIGSSNAKGKKPFDHNQECLDLLSHNFCNLLNLPHYPYGEDLLTLHTCVFCYEKLKLAGTLIRKLEQLSLKISEYRNEIENLILTSQVNLNSQSSFSRSFKFRQNVIKKLSLTNPPQSNPDESIGKEKIENETLFVKFVSIKEEEFEPEGFPTDVESEGDQTDFEGNDNEVNNSPIQKCKRKLKDSAQIDSICPNVKSEISPEIQSVSNLQIRPNFDIELLKKTAMEQIVKIQLRRIESMTKTEIDLLLKSEKSPKPQKSSKSPKPAKSPKSLKVSQNCKLINKTKQKPKILFKGRIKYEEIKINDRLNFKCLVPGCGQILTNPTSRTQHIYDHYSEKIECPICSTTFDYPRNLKQHLNRHHKDKTRQFYLNIVRDHRIKMKKIAKDLSSESQADLSNLDSNSNFQFPKTQKIEESDKMEISNMTEIYDLNSDDSNESYLSQSFENCIESETSEKNQIKTEIKGEKEIEETKKSKNCKNEGNSKSAKSRPSVIFRYRILEDTETGKKKFQCLVPGCGQILTNRTGRSDHKYFHSEKKIPCPLCHRQYQYPRTLRQHLKISHKQKTNNNLFIKTMIEFRVQIANDPIYIPGENKIEKPQPTKKEKLWPLVPKRTKILSDEKVVCEFCGKFYSKRKLAEHKRTHLRKSEANSICCELCGKVLSNKSALKAHVKRIHEMTEDQRREEKEICPICGVVTKGKYSLKRHLISHSEARPYICKVEGCGKKFKRKGDLDLHEFKHSRQRPYICPKCGKRFSLSTIYRVHVKTHNIVMNHHCGICHQKFKMWEYLYVHLRRHRDKDKKNGIPNSPAIQLLKDISRVNKKERPKKINKGINIFDNNGNLIESSEADLSALTIPPVPEQKSATKGTKRNLQNNLKHEYT